MRIRCLYMHVARMTFKAVYVNKRFINCPPCIHYRKSFIHGDVMPVVGTMLISENMAACNYTIGIPGTLQQQQQHQLLNP